MDYEYSTKFYSDFQDGSLRSARAIVPLILEYVDAKSVCDLGCGVGTWLRAFNECGVADIRGFDGDYVKRDMLKIPAERFTAADLSRPIANPSTFDLAISLEVAEHLPESSAKTFVQSLTALAPVVVFSAAIPRQGGHGHINEQWPSYWRDLFGARGYVAIDCLRPRIWANSAIEFWYRQNIFFFVDRDKIAAYPRLAEAPKHNGPLDLVHPGQHAKDLRPPAEDFTGTLAKLPSLFTKAVVRRLRGGARASLADPS